MCKIYDNFFKVLLVFILAKADLLTTTIISYKGFYKYGKRALYLS